MHSIAITQGLNHPSEEQLPGALYSVQDVAEKLQLKPKKAKGKTEWHGANPKGGATTDGFILFAEGNAIDRKTEERFTSREVAELAGIAPGQYEPCATFAATNGHRSSATPETGARAPRAATNGTPKAPKTPKAPTRRSLVFDYQDGSGAVLFRVTRKELADGSKDFPVSRPNGSGGFIPGLGEVEPTLYRLPQVRSASRVFVVEGEKCADALNTALCAAEIGASCVATSAPFGAGKWRASYSEELTGKDVCVLPDNDTPGARHAAAVCSSTKDKAAKLRLVELPGLGEKGDVGDFLASGGTIEALFDLMEVAPQWMPETAPEPEPPAKEEQLNAPETAPMFPVLSYKERRARPRPEWLIDELFPCGGTSWLTADSGAFKSFWALDAALCIATGRDFHGRQVKQGNVIYVAAEGAGGFPDRENAWEIYAQTEIPDPPVYGVVERPADISDPAVLAGFLASLRAFAPVFIVLDTQSRCSVGRDLNTTAEATVFYNAVSTVARELGAHCSILAHNNRNGDYAGNHQGKAMVDTHLTLKREGKRCRLKCIKQKDGAAEEVAAMGFETRVVELGFRDTKGRMVTSLVLEAVELEDEPEPPAKEELTAKTRAQVLEVLAVQFPKGATGGEWKEAVEKKGIKKSNFYSYRSELLRSGAVLEANRHFIASGEAAP